MCSKFSIWQLLVLLHNENTLCFLLQPQGFADLGVTVLLYTNKNKYTHILKRMQLLSEELITKIVSCFILCSKQSREQS